MTPQEAQLVNDLFDRVAKLESAPRDPAAERLIADGMQRAPHAVYALVQTTLVQDEALRRANARIEELQAQAANAEPVEQRPASFLDTMREALTGHATRGSVPSVRPQNLQPQGAASQNFQARGGQPEAAYQPPPPPGYAGGAPFSSGGSFLGTAASTAAGVIGGSLLLNGIRSMFGHHGVGYGPSSFGGFGGDATSPWSNAGERSAANSDLARDAGIDRISDRPSDDAIDPSGGDQSAADPDDAYDTDDGSDTGDDEYDAGDTDSDSYDV